ncbi:hypothetical protein BUALT_Bualt09G0025200 [Buddleja alternifolia]|uniref:TF-B3 domain-containing protein n=1 Tax=Buddleja alternifolia TaxID=168488 RepID=A0AAV6X7I5_9LAMI|nr:hypothetical protein BUALT_Bualt09G0025200 [Buddleja alternifolia]
MAGNRHDPLNFFKVMFGATWQVHVDLPPLFVIRSNASVGDVLIIHTSRGATAFRLIQSNNGLLALSGPEWSRFVSANNIQETYILLFLHQGNMHFNVNIFDQTAICIDSEEDNDENEVPAAGTRTWSVNMKWITCHNQSGIEGRQSFALKEGWLEFANANRIRGGDVCMFKMTEEVGNIVNMDVVLSGGVECVDMGNWGEIFLGLINGLVNCYFQFA